jgi:membrane-associated phospholipid phosphatase
METIHMLQGFASSGLDGFAMTVTNLADEMVYIALLIVTYLGFSPQYGRNLGIYFLLAMYSNGLLKDLFNSPRPFELDPAVLRVPEALDTAGGAGFPSGHAQSAATFWGVAARYVRLPWFTVTAIVLILLISVSRLYLGVHMPADVIAGVLLGAVIVALVPLLDRFRLKLAATLQVVLALAVPLALHLLAPTDNSGMLLGGLSGFLLAPLLHAYRVPSTVSGRVLVTLLGLTLVFVALLGSSALLPEDFKRDALGGYLRYLLIALIGLAGTPLLFGVLQYRRQAAPGH